MSKVTYGITYLLVLSKVKALVALIRKCSEKLYNSTILKRLRRWVSKAFPYLLPRLQWMVYAYWCFLILNFGVEAYTFPLVPKPTLSILVRDHILLQNATKLILTVKWADLTGTHVIPRLHSYLSLLELYTCQNCNGNVLSDTFTFDLHILTLVHILVISVEKMANKHGWAWVIHLVTKLTLTYPPLDGCRCTK